MSAYSNLILGTAGLVSYWRLGEASGTVVDSKSAHNGTVTGATYGTTGLLTGDADKALSFTADTQKVAVANHADFQLTGGVTIEAWIRISSAAANMPIVECRKSDGTLGYVLETTSSDGLQLSCALNGAGGQSVAGTGYTANTIWHVVGTYDNAFLRIYQNGVQNAFNAQDWTGFPLATPSGVVVEIGHFPHSTESFRGVIDEVAIYNVALSPTTIAAHYALGHNGPSSVRLARQFQLRPY